MPLSPLDRKAELVRRRIRQSAIAAKCGCSKSHVSDVLYGRRRNEEIERVIATAIGMTPEEVFPPREVAVAV